MDDDDTYLGQMFGPKGENEDLVVKLITTVLLDYTYWRKNYYPDDPLVLTSALRRKYDSDRDDLVEATNLMVAQLRRSFPFYSPRYIAHQQSETTIASLVGALAGTLYNSNNVTTESGIATVEMEIDACNELLKLVGFTPMPKSPESLDDLDRYDEEVESNFGWCHLTSGGTVANIEALWVARTVKFFPLAVRDVCKTMSIDIQVAMPSPETEHVAVDHGRGKPSDEIRVRTESIIGLSDTALLGLRPLESINLIGHLTRALKNAPRPADKANRTLSEYVWDCLDTSAYSPKFGVGAIAKFRPRIFVSGAAHYSIEKAADLLGLGKNAVVAVPPDEHFRLDIAALRRAMKEARTDKDGPCTVLAVIGIAGTTEEGAVDPIDQLIDLRHEWEQTFNESFWIHVDAAWGGFIRSLFIGPDDHKLTRDVLSERLALFQREVLAAAPFNMSLDISPDREDVVYWIEQLVVQLRERLGSDPKQLETARLPSEDDIHRYFANGEEKGDYSNVLGNLEAMMNRYALAVSGRPWEWKADYFKTKRRDDAISSVKSFTTLKVDIVDDKRVPTVKWPPHVTIGRAFLAIEDADSVSIDPHKMGYTVYPNGAVAFKYDLVRHLVKQDAPYITSPSAPAGNESRRGAEDSHSAINKSGKDVADGHTPRREKAAGHHPIRHATKDDETGELTVKTEAFGSYTLEGSRPSAAACSLWLSTKSLQLNQSGHGKVIRASLRAARLMAQYMAYWKDHSYGSEHARAFEFCFFTRYPPDTNIVIFGVRPANRPVNLREYNEINNRLYRRFSILSEHGERSHSYSQPFFLSKTVFRPPHYPFSTLSKFFTRSRIECTADEYQAKGIVVLRATVMNPYIVPMKLGQQKKDLIFEFMKELHKAATAAVLSAAPQPRSAGTDPTRP